MKRCEDEETIMECQYGYFKLMTKHRDKQDGIMDILSDQRPVLCIEISGKWLKGMVK
jgi:hypothetical protein